MHDICSDKTGTITVGRMVVKKAWVPSLPAASSEDLAQTPYDVQSGQYYSVESAKE